MLLVDDSFFFLHVPKTGGSFIQTVLLEHLPADDCGLDTHTPFARLPARAQGLPGFCVIRNPWDWYVSWFHYQSERGPRRTAPIADPGKRGVWEGALGAGEASFAEAVTRACNGDFEHPLTAVMRERGLDFYSARLLEIAGEALERPDFTVVRHEQLARQTLRFLRRHTEVTPELKRALRHRAPVKASSHRHYATYYDRPLRELVGERTAWLCDRFEYRFEAGEGAAAGPDSPAAGGGPG